MHSYSSSGLGHNLIWNSLYPYRVNKPKYTNIILIFDLFMKWFNPFYVLYITLCWYLYCIIKIISHQFSVCLLILSISSLRKDILNLKVLLYFFHEISNFMEIHHYFSPNDFYSRTFTMSFTKTISLIEFSLKFL